MIIGIDFDNTLVSYDTLFHRVACAQGLIPADLPVSKTAVRDHLRATGREALWTEMQGTVYGARLAEAEAFPGALNFLKACRQRGIPVRIISHKTRQPYLGARHDLHAAARAWLQQHGLTGPATGLADEHVFFELTKAAKLGRIDACGCTHFIDDLPELLNDPAFPTEVARFLFDPQNAHAAAGNVSRHSSWTSLHASLLEAESESSTLAGLAARFGLSPAGPAPQPMQGGANNRVYRLPLADGTAVLAKQYFQHAGDRRDRFASERAFYAYAGASQLAQVPAAIGWDENERLGLFSFIAGQRVTTVEASHLEAALDFVSALNQHRQRPEAGALPAAAEACFSIDAHLDAIQSRIERLHRLPAQDALDSEARSFVEHDLLPAWQAIGAQVRAHFDQPARIRECPPAERCISPSDFGFHNAIVQPAGRIVFVDFEYAGWDDPAKLVADFFCQPDVPVPLRHFEQFVAALAAALRLPDHDAFAARCRALLPVYQIKWAGILLADFTTVGRDRRIFSLGEVAAVARRQRQLARARTVLGNLLQAA